MDEIRGRMALVTGASRGIGRDIAMALAAAGAHVVVNYRVSAALADEVVQKIAGLGGTALALQADVSDPAAASELVREAEARFGALDIVVNNAGMVEKKPLDEIGPPDWERTLRVNLSSAFYVTQAALPGMRARRWGRIIMLLSLIHI